MNLRTFSWGLPTGINVNNPVYEQYRILVHLNNTYSFNYTYYFGWYGIGQSGHNNLTPYPTDGGGANDGNYINPTPNNNNVGGTQQNIINIFTNWQNVVLIIIYAIACCLGAYYFAFTGLIAGFDIATVICFITGLLGGLMYPVLGLVIIANVALIVTGSGLLNKTKGIES